MFLHCLKDLLSHHIIRPNTTVEALCCQGALLRLQFALIGVHQVVVLSNSSLTSELELESTFFGAL